jgi:hypothetical protein
MRMNCDEGRISSIFFILSNVTILLRGCVYDDMVLHPLDINDIAEVYLFVFVVTLYKDEVGRRHAGSG